MKKLICILLVLLPVFSIYSNDINNYNTEFIFKIENGRKSGQVWYDKYGLPHHSRAFTISKKENVYVCDPYNNRINIYDKDFNYIKNITNKEFTNDGVAFADKIIVDDFECLIILEHIEGLYKYTNDGKRIFKVSSLKLPNSVLGSDHFFPFDTNIAFFNTEKKLCLIDKNGEMENTIESQFGDITKLKESENRIENMMYTYIKDNGLLYYNEKLFPINYYSFNNMRKEILKESDKTINTQLPEPEPDLFIEQHLMGYDNNNNIYWQGYWDNYKKRVIAVFSKNLVLLDFFTYKLPGKEDTYEAVAPNGDIYIMQPEPEGVYFYKITRHW